MMVILGAWQSSTIWGKVPAILAVWGLVVTGVYLLRAVKDAWYGEQPARWSGLKDARTAGERAPFAILVAVLLVFGFWPQPMLDVIRQGTNPLLHRLGVTSSGARVEQAAAPPSAPAESPSGLRPGGPGARGAGDAR
jgi:NADH-quinone oxidoreductase subunit M